MKTTTINIEGMHCASCENLLAEVLGETQGVKTAKVSLKEKKADVEFDPKEVTEGDLRKAIEAEGYKTA